LEDDGGYHQAQDQKRKNDFKDDLLAAVGVPVQRVTATELTNFEPN